MSVLELLFALLLVCLMAGIAVVAFLVWNLVYGIKGQYMDFDPINVYFWLFAGILMKLPALESVRPDEPR